MLHVVGSNVYFRCFCHAHKCLRYFVIFVLLVDFVATSCFHKDNTSCETCVSDFNCYWCVEKNHCGDKTIGRHFLGKIRRDCGGGEWFSYRQCSVDGTYISHVIYAGTVVGVLLLVILIGIYCYRAYKRRDYDMADVVAAYNARTPFYYT